MLVDQVASAPATRLRLSSSFRLIAAMPPKDAWPALSIQRANPMSESKSGIASLEPRKPGSMMAARPASRARNMLLQQLNPHFLFNALNTVYALVLEADIDGARRAVLALSSVLRRTLEKETSSLTTFDEEITLLSDYLEIESARFADRLRVDLCIPAACRTPWRATSARMASMSHHSPPWKA